MENYVGKTLIDAMKNASKATGLSLETVRGIAHVIAEKKTLLSSQVIIGLFSERDVYAYACTYLDKVLALLRVRASYKLDYDSSNQVIKIIIETDRGSQVIGRNGENLKAINTLVRSAIFNRYGGDYRILLDCDGYKDIKYQKIISMAKRAAEDVLASHLPTVLPPMPADERMVIHRALSGLRDLEVSSTGDGKHRHIVIRYCPGSVVHSDYDRAKPKA